MTDIERLAKEAGFDWLTSTVSKGVERVTLYAVSPEDLAKFAALISEECAKEIFPSAGLQMAPGLQESHKTISVISGLNAELIRHKFPMPTQTS